MELKTIAETILSGGYAEFSYHGGTYLIQQEHNKGCHYLSLWRLTPPSNCMARVCCDDYDGVSEETIRELFDQPFSEEHTVRDVLHSSETIMRNGCQQDGKTMYESV